MCQSENAFEKIAYLTMRIRISNVNSFEKKQARPFLSIDLRIFQQIAGGIKFLKSFLIPFSVMITPLTNITVSLEGN